MLYQKSSAFIYCMYHFLGMPRVVHFELAVDDFDRAIKFYKSVFGWKIEKWEGPIEYWLITTGDEKEPGIDGALQPRKDAPQPTVNTVGVDDIDDYVKKIEKAGGKITAPKIAIPGVGWFALAEDTEENAFGLMQGDPEAK
jgi:predicted enzyme related to lactoylglutathione lyase